ncbi:hypothetical protein TrRE_jg10758 [Triparma retinervis]|uniref:DNA 3'-5' helicase n=1 Tax=Triparma retinervis TaxID=2557542 RepID=A0A9W7AM49_9STRA|nr:hypothetical protein TrRE_jg10758 [Triparma retinervis]
MLLSVLNTKFNLPSFRKNQDHVIKATLKGYDVFLIMRTGGGKSLCTYQLPSLLEYNPPLHPPQGMSVKKGVSVVIVPLISLMEDQVKAYNGKFGPNRAVAFKGAGKKSDDRGDGGNWALVRGGEANVLLCTPEKMLKSPSFQREIKRLHEEDRIRR